MKGRYEQMWGEESKSQRPAREKPVWEKPTRERGARQSSENQDSLKSLTHQDLIRRLDKYKLVDVQHAIEDLGIEGSIFEAKKFSRTDLERLVRHIESSYNTQGDGGGRKPSAASAQAQSFSSVNSSSVTEEKKSKKPEKKASSGISNWLKNRRVPDSSSRAGGIMSGSSISGMMGTGSFITNDLFSGFDDTWWSISSLGGGNFLIEPYYPVGESMLLFLLIVVFGIAMFAMMLPHMAVMVACQIMGLYFASLYNRSLPFLTPLALPLTTYSFASLCWLLMDEIGGIGFLGWFALLFPLLITLSNVISEVEFPQKIWALIHCGIQWCIWGSALKPNEVLLRGCFKIIHIAFVVTTIIGVIEFLVNEVKHPYLLLLLKAKGVNFLFGCIPIFVVAIVSGGFSSNIFALMCLIAAIAYYIIIFGRQLPKAGSDHEFETFFIILYPLAITFCVWLVRDYGTWLLPLDVSHTVVGHIRTGGLWGLIAAPGRDLKDMVVGSGRAIFDLLVRLFGYLAS